MWGASIVGFGDNHYSYDSGREGDRFVVGFSPRKASLTLYLMDGFEKYGDLLDRLGKHSTGKACLIKRMTDIDPAERSGEARSVLVPARVALEGTLDLGADQGDLAVPDRVHENPAGLPSAGASYRCASVFR